MAIVFYYHILYGFIKNVADIQGSNLLLSAKHSLVCYAEDIPSDITQMRPLSIARVSKLFFLLALTLMFFLSDIIVVSAFDAFSVRMLLDFFCFLAN